MAVKVIRQFVSDQSGVKIPDGKGVAVRVKFADKVFKADLTEKEARELIKLVNARSAKPRARRAGADDVEALLDDDDDLGEQLAASVQGNSGTGGGEWEPEVVSAG